MTRSARWVRIAEKDITRMPRSLQHSRAPRLQCDAPEWRIRGAHLLPWRVLLTLLSCVATALQAQRLTMRDSSEIEVVTSVAPTLPPSQALRLDLSPTLVIGMREGVPYEFAQVRGAARLSNGSIVVADGASTELRLFDAQGTFVKLLGRKGGGPGEFPRVESVVHLRADTLAVIAGIGRAVYYDGSGTFLWNINHYTSPIDRGSAGLKMIVGAFGDGSTVLVSVGNPPPRTRGERWLQTYPVSLIDRRNATIRALGDLPISTFVMDEYPRPPWFAAPIATANSSESFYIGLGTEYSIREYTTPTRITRDDIDRYVLEWGKRWIRSTGADAEQERADLRDDPYESVVPAFSQFIVDRANRLWVRTPELRDAPRAGQLNSMPLVPSAWSVFDRNGAWLCNVTLPANSQPLEIGADYVLAVARDADGLETVVLYRLRGGR